MSSLRARSSRHAARARGVGARSSSAGHRRGGSRRRRRRQRRRRRRQRRRRRGEGKAGGEGGGEGATIPAHRWLARFDEDAEAAAAAEAAWAAFVSGGARRDAAADVPDGLSAVLLPLLGHVDERIRAQVGRALAGAARVAPAGFVQALLPKLFEMFKERTPTAAPADRKARIIAQSNPDEAAEDEEAMAAARIGVAGSLGALGPHLDARMQLPIVFAFLKRALGDRHEGVAAAIVDAGREIIDAQPQPDVMRQMLAPMLDASLAEEAKDETDDRIRQGVIFYLGALAKHMPADDAKIVQVVTRLMGALGTPSEMVQRTIGQSLASLVGKAAVRPSAPDHLRAMLTTLTTDPSYAARRGAAFGIAGVVKGSACHHSRRTA